KSVSGDGRGCVAPVCAINTDCTPPLRLGVRGAQIRKLPQDIGVGLEARGRTLIFRQERDAVIDHVVGEDPAVGILRGLGWIETEHVGNGALVVAARSSVAV